jgi:hypothetical protein
MCFLLPQLTGDKKVFKSAKGSGPPGKPVRFEPVPAVTCREHRSFPCFATQTSPGKKAIFFPDFPENAEMHDSSGIKSAGILKG